MVMLFTLAMSNSCSDEFLTRNPGELQQKAYFTAKKV
jgi:hypothetical protein